jgi:imidazolonepropionase-like amidohydrolase
MRPAVARVLPLVLAAACGGGHDFVSRPAAIPPGYAIRNVRVFDAARGALLDGLLDVFVRDGRIVAVAKPGRPADGLVEIDGRAGTLLPGLVDAHGHVVAGTAPPWLGELPNQTENLEAFLYAGVTTVLDAAALTPAVFGTRRQLAAGELVGPRLYAAGPMFTAPGGHPVAILRATVPFFLRWYVVPRLSRELGTPDEARAAVGALLAERPDVVKVVIDRLPPDAPRIGNDVLAALVARAHEGGLRVVAHIGTSVDVEDAMAAGVDALLHGVYLEDISDAAVAAVRARNAPVAPTISVFDRVGEAGRMRPDGFSPLEREIAKPEVLQALTRFPEPTTPDLERQKAMFAAVAAGRDARRRNVAKLRAAGVTILAGSDSANTGHIPGAALHLELAALVEAGMTPGEALRAATLDNARFIAGADPEFGSIAPGKRADLVLVEGDPTADIRATQRIRDVFQNGVQLERRPRQDPGGPAR